MEGNREGLSEIVNYVPGEICLVITTDQLAEPDRLYEATRSELNRQVATLLPQYAKREPNPFEQDLLPSHLRQHFEGQSEILRPLERTYGDAQRGESGAPWISLPNDGARSTMLACYQIGDVRPAAVAENRAVQIQHVRELVNLINRSARQVPRQFAGDRTYQIEAATPNWLVGATQHICAGPGAQPAAAPAGRWSFHASHPRLEAILQRARTDAGSSDVVVAVLDASPTQAQVVDATRRYPENWLLQDVARNVTIDGPLSMSPTYFQHLDPYLVNWQADALVARLPKSSFRIPDHGLFVAGIVRDLAPGAEVHLIRALNEYGVGDLLSLIYILTQLPERLLRSAQQRLVVNLSLVVDVPMSERFVRLWFEKCCEDPKLLQQRWADISTTLETLHASIAAAISWLNRRGVLVVAAAGNDAFRSPLPPEPRIPARYDSVLGVAACRRGTAAAAEYSNRGDVVVLGNGVATFGGNARQTRPDAPPVIDTRSSPVDAVVGVFSADQIPLQGGANTTGWVYWAGTSFAAPVMSGIAANVWAADRKKDPKGVIADIFSFKAPPSDPADPNGPLDAPSVLAFQTSE